MRKVLKVMDKTGDTRVEFDETDTVATEAARAEYDKLMKRAGVVVTVPGPGQQGEVVKKFEDLAPENVFVPAIVGG
jgi:hypothetical protein